MKYVLLIALASLVGNIAWASGFVCKDHRGQLILEAKAPEKKLTVSPSSRIGRAGHNTHSQQGITFNQQNSNLTIKGKSTFVAYMSAKSPLKGFIDKTNLKQLYALIFHIEMNHQDPTAKMSRLTGNLTLVKKNGGKVSYNLSCQSTLDEVAIAASLYWHLK